MYSPIIKIIATAPIINIQGRIDKIIGAITKAITNATIVSNTLFFGKC